MFHTKKSILTTIFTFFVFSHVFALNMQDAETDSFFGMESTSETTTNTTTENSSDISNYTTTEINGGIYQSYVDIDREVFVEHWDDCKDNSIHRETPIEYLNDKSCSSNLNVNNNSDSQSNQYNSETSHESPSSRSQQHDHMEDWIKDNALESRKQEANNNPASQTNTQYVSQKNAQYDRNHANATQRQLFDKALDKTNNSHDLANKLSLPIVEKYFKQLRYDTAAKYANKHTRFLDRKKIFPIEQAELKFLDLLISGEIKQLLKQIQHPDLSIAEEAFTKLKKLWPWKREHTFLTSSHQNGTGESGFIVNLGINIMEIAERDLISRLDYIAQHADTQSFKIIQEYREKCIALQQQGDRNALFQEKLQLQVYIFNNNKNDDFTSNVCYAIAEKAYLNTITSILYNIVHTLSLEKALNQLHYLEIQILDQAQQQNITLTNQIKNFIIQQYGFDVLEAGYNCYTSRADYIHTPNDQSVLSNNLSPILHNIEHKSLPMAHEELAHLQKQIIEALESLNITDTTTQKELIVKKFGIDILEQANSTYKNRSDHKELMNSFIPIDVHSTSINILNNSHDYASVGQEFDTMAEQVFHNARLCKLDFVENIENHIIDSIHIIKAPQNDAQFVFNVTVVDHLLTDIQHKVNDIVEGKSTSYMQYIERGSELFTRAIVKFIEGLNPVTQVKSIYEVFKAAGHHLKNAALATAHEIYDPITATQNNLLFYTQACESLVNSARFTADLTIGKIYLSPEEYQQRCNTFYKTFEPITTENLVDFTAQIAADFAFGKGLSFVFIYLKEIDAASKLENYAAKIAYKFKQAVDTHLADNPILVTTEGLVLKTSNDLKNVGEAAKEIITDSRTFMESITTGIIDIELFNNLKAIGNNLWQSPGGIVYGYDRKFGNTLNHILAHMTPNTIKKNHTVFNISKNNLVQLIDEAWAIKGCPLTSDPRAYIVNMKKIIGTKGETAIRIVLKEPGTCEILTAYPITI